MKKKVLFVCIIVTLISLLSVTAAFADPIPNIDIQVGDSGGKPSTSSLSILLLITVISIAPALLVLMTSFTRIVIVLGFVRTSLGTQQMPLTRSS